MKIRYAIEKEIEVPDDYPDEMIDDVIKAKCEEEKGFDYIYASRVGREGQLVLTDREEILKVRDYMSLIIASRK